MTNRANTSRLITVAFLLLALFCGLGCRLAYLHLSPQELGRDILVRRGRVERTIAVSRGRIRGAKGGVLALDVNLKDIIADPHLIMSNACVAEVATNIASILGTDAAEIARKLNRPGRRWAKIGRFVDLDTATQIGDMNMPGVWSEEIRARRYPQGAFMCHVVGFLNHKGVGCSGVEQLMYRFLRGRPGAFEARLDGKQRELYDRRIQDISPREGADVYLTLNQHVQHILEKALDGLVATHKPRAAWAIVQSIPTGEILGMASRPAYDLNKFGQSTKEQRLNRAIGHIYEPGSTLKIVTVAAALAEGLVSLNTSVDCHDGVWSHQGHLLHCHRPHGKIIVGDILKRSCNIGVAKLAVMVGDEKLEKYLRAFGVGSLTGIDLPGEEKGILHPARNWSGISSSRIAIGQGVAVTSMQMLGIMCAVANDGVMIRPYVVKRVVGSGGTLLYEGRPQTLGRVLDKSIARTVLRLLTSVTNDDGTGRRAQVEGYLVAGKTGTAQKPEAGGYSKTKYVASFVGALPADNPQLAIIVVVDEPQPIHTGGRVAAPVFATIARESLRCLGVNTMAKRGTPIFASAP